MRLPRRSTVFPLVVGELFDLGAIVLHDENFAIGLRCAPPKQYRYRTGLACRLKDVLHRRSHHSPTQSKPAGCYPVCDAVRSQPLHHAMTIATKPTMITEGLWSQAPRTITISPVNRIASIVLVMWRRR